MTALKRSPEARHEARHAVKRRRRRLRERDRSMTKRSAKHTPCESGADGWMVDRTNNRCLRRGRMLIHPGKRCRRYSANYIKWRDAWFSEARRVRRVLEEQAA